ncbi:MAG: cell surface protein [Myxococcota bacterium]|nr:cell surface protein [Myxococcota bacterium]MEC9442983.1 cell surface protein [Myxococcota bacterium]
MIGRARDGVVLILALFVSACGFEDAPEDPVEDHRMNNEDSDLGQKEEDMEDPEPVEKDWREEGLPYLDEIVSFEPGEGAGFGQENMPEVALGPPVGKGTGAGSFDVVSLGVGGEIILSVGDGFIVDGEGDDFIVYENPFWASKDPLQVFAELGEVSVSEDGEEWHVFPCSLEPEPEAQWHGCAGWTPTLVFDPFEHPQLDQEVTGGDAFDLSVVGLERAKYVKVRDLSTEGFAPSAGFDFDAVGVIHLKR